MPLITPPSFRRRNRLLGLFGTEYVRTYCSVSSQPACRRAVASASTAAATSLRCRAAPGKHVPKEDALEAFHRNRTSLRLGHENGALERAHDEAGELVYIGFWRQLPCLDRCFQAVGDRRLVLREHRGDTKTNRVAGLARFRTEVAVETSSTHVVLAQVHELSADPRSQPIKRRQPVVSQRRPDRSARHRPVTLEDLESKGLLRSERVRERPLRSPV